MAIKLGAPAGEKRDSVRDILKEICPGHAKALVENVEKVKKGDTKEDIEHLLGKADNPTDKEWLYYLDEHSGYIIAFDSASRVEAVNAWKS